MLENIVKKTKQFVKSKTFIVVLAAGPIVTYTGCEQEAEEECCSCLVDNNCTFASRSKCEDIFYGGKSISVDNECVKENGCYLPCAKAGAYFE